eukprot:CAMPEP_0194264906 /NCGR_PEP_ID=MMETSP0169-20130528/263_1 /TAXON_ID=218684 /ORGANISM="Corethron pennatum, Strain L29A3" /LENGTH=494 /DNA_ID=CAMNT_0039005241 /DNA_START=128 /DNA_END=1612 /DNA_ORIENTATION=+
MKETIDANDMIDTKGTTVTKETTDIAVDATPENKVPIIKSILTKSVTLLNDPIAQKLEEKLLKLAHYIKALQQVVQEAETKATITEEKVCEVRKEFLRVQEEKEAVQGAFIILKQNLEIQKEEYEDKIKIYDGQVEELKNKSREKIEALITENTEVLDTLKCKISALEKELESAQEECIRSNDLFQVSKNEITDFEENLKAEQIFHKESEEISSKRIAELELEISVELCELRSIKEKQLKEATQKYEKLESLYNNQTKVLSSKVALLEKYENETGSVLKIAKLGIMFVGEQTKESLRSASRGASSRGRSLIRGVRSQSKSKVRSKPGSKNYSSKASPIDTGLRSRSKSEVGSNSRLKAQSSKVLTSKEDIHQANEEDDPASLKEVASNKVNPNNETHDADTREPIEESYSAGLTKGVAKVVIQNVVANDYNFFCNEKKDVQNLVATDNHNYPYNKKKDSVGLKEECSQEFNQLEETESTEVKKWWKKERLQTTE